MTCESEVFSRPNDSAKIHDLEQFTLWANTPNRPGFRARMTFGERNGAPRISVFPNTEEGAKVLFVGMHPMIWAEFLRRFEVVAKSSGGAKDKIENLDRDPTVERTNGNMDAVKKIVRNTLWFGKDQDGVCWIAIEQTGCPNIRFKILSSVWHNFFKEDGTRLTPEECSAAQTMALIETLRVAMMPYIARIRKPFEKQAKKAARPAGDPVSLTSMGIDEDIAY